MLNKKTGKWIALYELKHKKTMQLHSPILLPPLEEWQSKGKEYNLPPFGHRIFYLDQGNPAAPANKTLLALHGFPESSFSFHKVLPGLLEVFERVVLFDMPGFGLSDKPLAHFSYSLIEQADAALSLWMYLGLRGGHLLAHDMGDSVATELAFRQLLGLLPAGLDQELLSYTFTNGSMLLDLARLRITQRVLLSPFGPLLSRWSNYRLFRQQLRSAHGSSDLSELDIALMWNNLQQSDGHRKTYLLIRYLNDRRRFEASRWLPALARLEVPVHVCWGTADAVARVEIAHQLKAEVCPHARLSLIPGAGHFCQLGSPRQWLEKVRAFYTNT
ncbi:MAG: alpha/beta hydrolase [Bacteroidetes bacterium]|nr:MAG: alpha/beta hydrolase [Bacteroidota bacterium]